MILTSAPILDDLFQHHAWATAKLLDRCQDLTDTQWNAPQLLGPGSLRATLVHMLGAEVAWLARWRGQPAEMLKDQQMSATDFKQRFQHVDADRQQFLSGERDNDYRRQVTYQNFKGEAFSNSIAGMALHVANHAVHHRAQALQFLRCLGITFPGGLDYIFYRMAHPTVQLAAATIATCRQYGLEVNEATTAAVPFEAPLLLEYGAYGDWGIERIFQQAETLSNEQLDAPFEMGMGSLRKTLLHIQDAEKWWLSNWRGTAEPFPHSDITMSLPDLRRSWSEIAEQRARYVGSMNGERLSAVVAANFGAGIAHFRVGESLLQLCGHGTHHRAQASNMLRRLGAAAPALDLIVWLRERAAENPILA